MFGFGQKKTPAILGAEITPVNIRRYWWIFAVVYGIGMVLFNVLTLGFGISASNVVSYLIAGITLVMTAGAFFYENERVVTKKERRLLALGSLAMSFAVTSVVMFGVYLLTPEISFFSMMSDSGEVGLEFFIALSVSFMLLYVLFLLCYRMIFFVFQMLIAPEMVKEKGKKKMLQAMLIALLSLWALGCAFYGLLYFYMTMFPPDDFPQDLSSL